MDHVDIREQFASLAANKEVIDFPCHVVLDEMVNASERKEVVLSFLHLVEVYDDPDAQFLGHLMGITWMGRKHRGYMYIPR